MQQTITAKKSSAFKAKPKQALADVQKAIDYIKAGGKIDAIKAKYQLTSEQEQKLTTL